MADSNAFGLLIWVDDRPIEENVLKLSRITTPFYFDNDIQERDYTSYYVGQNVVVKCLDGSKHKAIIGGIEGK